MGMSANALRVAVIMINFRMQMLLSVWSWIRGKRCHSDAVAGGVAIYSLSEYSFIHELEYLFIGLKTHGLRRLTLMSFSWDGALQRISRIESAPSRISGRWRRERNALDVA